MTEIDELSRVIGSLESNITTLYKKHDAILDEIKSLNKTLQKRRIKDASSAVAAGFLGGFSAVAAKFIFWKSL